MKKINEKQRAVIKFFLKQLSFWENTSDIDSLTHYSDIREFTYQLHHTDSCFIVDDLDRIEAVARIMYQTIKGIK